MFLLVETIFFIPWLILRQTYKVLHLQFKNKDHSKNVINQLQMTNETFKFYLFCPIVVLSIPNRNIVLFLEIIHQEVISRKTV